MSESINLNCKQTAITHLSVIVHSNIMDLLARPNPLVSPDGILLKPHYLDSKHFLCNLDKSTIITIINETLLDSNFNDYDYNAKTCEWKGFYASGTIYCSFEINIFFDKPNMPLIIEPRCMSGDCSSFYDFYFKLKPKLTSEPEIKHAQLLSFQDDYQMSEEEVKEAMGPIHSMANEDYPEAYYLGAQLLYNLTSRTNIRKLLCENGCLPILYKFASSDAEHTCRCAVFSLANLSEDTNCQEMIAAERDIIPLLNSLVKKGGDYNTAAMRRAAVQCIHNVMSSFL